jgi:predicted nucleotidyltransferase
MVRYTIKNHPEELDHISMSNNIKTLNEIKKILVQHKGRLVEKYKIGEIGVFGSYSRGEQRKNSDIDILVQFDSDIGFFKFLEFEEYLSNILGVKVDLVTKEALKPYIGKRILEEVVYL